VTAQPATPETVSGEEPELIGTEWQLVEYTISGRTTTVPDEVDSGLRFDKRGASPRMRASTPAAGLLH
jgi:hypothetical protein